MGKNSAVVDSAERAHDLLTPGARWLNEVVQALRPALDSGLGIFGWLYDARDFENPHFTEPVFLDIPERLPEALIGCMLDPATPAALTRMHYRTPAGPFSASLGEHFANYQPWRRHVFPTGVKDLLVVNGIDANRQGCAISAPRRAITRISAERLSLLQRLSVHLATAYRLRRRMSGLATEAPGPAHSRVEAVLSPAGRLEHASSLGQSREARQALSLAVRAAERARGKLRRADPEEAMKLWKSMVNGRWSLSDHFESDGRRYILAYVNPPASPSVRSLSALERQVLSYTALGKSNKLIAHELGVPLHTIAAALKRATSKLGAKRPRDLLALMDRVLSAPVAEEQ